MTDDIEERLRRYRPVAPNSALRGRLLAAADAPRVVRMQAVDWGMIATAAALLLAAFGTAPSGVQSAETAEEAAWKRQVAVVASMLDGERAHDVAEVLVPRPEATLPWGPR
jgi:hypothetical protein